MTWDARCPWVQVHTTDTPGGRAHRRCLAVEPMTCPPDAFNSGTDVRRLEAGDTATWTCTLAAV
jgi:aldose 1-epimerase